MGHSISKVQFSRCHFNCVASPEVVKSSAWDRGNGVGMKSPKVKQHLRRVQAGTGNSRQPLFPNLRLQLFPHLRLFDLLFNSQPCIACMISKRNEILLWMKWNRLRLTGNALHGHHECRNWFDFCWESGVWSLAQIDEPVHHPFDACSLPTFPIRSECESIRRKQKLVPVWLKACGECMLCKAEMTDIWYNDKAQFCTVAVWGCRKLIHAARTYSTSRYQLGSFQIQEYKLKTFKNWILYP